MKETLKKLVKRLDKDVEGGIPVGEIMMIAAIAIPLILAMVTFGDQVVGFLRTIWGTLNGTGVADF